MKKFGFTLAEVLITLVIIGVIAAMTIPTLMNQTNQQEFKVGLKKAMSTINQAIQLHYALTGERIGDDGLKTEKEIIDNLFKKRLVKISWTPYVDAILGIQPAYAAAFATTDENYDRENESTIFATNGDFIPEMENILIVSDGIKIALGNFTSSGKYDPERDEMYYGLIMIDVNGNKGPNSACLSSKAPTDTYIGTVYSSRVIAGNTQTDSEMSKATKEIMFNKKNKK